MLLNCIWWWGSVFLISVASWFMEVCLEWQLSVYKIESVIRVQTLNKAACILLNTNNPSVLPQGMGKK